MPNFQIKNREEMRGNAPTNPPQAVEELPCVDMAAFGFSGDAGSALHRSFTYGTREHSLSDVSRNGYFGGTRLANDIRDFGVKEWDTVTCTIGDDPVSAIEVDLRVVSIAKSREEPIIVALGQVRDFRKA